MSGGMFADLTPPYSTIVADPPWPYDTAPLAYQRESGKASFLPYSTMTLDELAAMPVGSLGCDDAHLFVWTTHGFLWDTKPLVESWGFRVRSTLVWCKAPMGGLAGGAFTPQTEFVLVCRRNHGPIIQAAREAAGLTLREVHDAVRGGAPTGLVGMWEQGIRYPTPSDWGRLGEALGHDFTICGNLAGTDRNWWTWSRRAHSQKPEAFMDLVESVAPGPYLELFARSPRLGWDSWGHGYETERAS